MRVARSVLGLAKVSVSGRSEPDAMANSAMMPSTGDSKPSQRSKDGPMNRSRGAFCAVFFPLLERGVEVAIEVKRANGGLPRRQDVTKGRKRR